MVPMVFGIQIQLSTVILPLLFSFWAGWPHPAWAGAGAHPAPQQFPGTRASGQPQVVLDAQPLSQGPDAWAALPGPHR